MERLKFDVGIVVPLKEEFRYVVEVAPQIEAIPYEGTYFYRLDFGAISTVCCLVGQMGSLPALQAATRLLGFANVKLLVVLGLGGALDDDIVVGETRYAHLFQVLPVELQDPAFLDRIHAYLPGWEMPKIRPENYSIGYGLLTDYMAEIFAELRRRNFQTHVNAWVELGNMTGRNQDAIKKTTAGLLKLLHPHRSPDSISRGELVPMLETAIEMRKRVTDQLAKMLPAEFAQVEYGFKVRER